MLQGKAGVVSWIDRCNCIEFFRHYFACFTSACMFVLFDRDIEADFLMSCYDTKLSISTVCLVH